MSEQFVPAVNCNNNYIWDKLTILKSIIGINASGQISINTTGSGPNGNPSNLVAATVSDTQIDLTWTDNSTNEDGFSIERSTDGITYAEINTVAAGVTSYSDTGLTGSTLYYYRVRAYKGTQYSGYSNVTSSTTLTDKFLFLGYYSQISGGQMPNLLGVDHLVVAGVAGSETYQTPNTAAYIAADTDLIWFNSPISQRTVTTVELIGYDFSRTIVKYDNTSPYQIRMIGILKAGEVLTQAEENVMRTVFDLSIWWSGVLSLYGSVKGNRTIGRSVFINILNILTDGNTKGWYDSQDLTTITKDASEHVTVWKNKLGVNTTDLTTVTGTPHWSVDGILFDGVGDSLKRAFAWVQPEYIYMVVKQVTWTANDRFFDGNTLGSGYVQQYAVGSPAIRANAGADSGGSGLQLPIDTWGIIRIFFNAGTSKLQINNNAAITGNFGTNDMAGIRIGAGGLGTSLFSNIQVKEVILRTSIASEADIFSYLNVKYSIV